MLPVIDDPPPMKTKRTVLDWRLNSQSSFQEGTRQTFSMTKSRFRVPRWVQIFKSAHFVPFSVFLVSGLDFNF